MRFVSLITSVVVMVTLYYLVIERDALLSFAGRAPGEAGQPPPEEAAPEAAVTTGQPAESAEDGTIAVLAVHSAAQEVTDTVLVRGRTEAARQVDVLAETSGRIISEPLRKGAFIEKGQTLCRIDPGTREAELARAEAALVEARAGLPVAEARVSEAEALLAEAEINYRAAVALRAEGYASETRAAAAAAAVSSARAAVESAKSGLVAAQSAISAADANVASARKEIERLTIAAPFSGLLESDGAELGTLLQPGSRCATVIALDPIKLVGFIAETEVGKVSVNAPAGARLATGREVQGLVSFLSRSADPQTRTFRVEVQIPNPDLSIRDGQTAEMILSSGTTRAHLIPQSALTLDDAGRIGVRIVGEGNTAEFLPVRVLRDSPDGVWLTGLPDFADVIVIGQEYVTDGVRVAPSFEGIGQ